MKEINKNIFTLRNSLPVLGYHSEGEERRSFSSTLCGTHVTKIGLVFTSQDSKWDVK